MKQRLLIEFEMPNFEEMCKECKVSDSNLLKLDMNGVINDCILDILNCTNVADEIVAHLMHYYSLYFSKKNKIDKRKNVIDEGCKISFHNFDSGLNLLASLTSTFEKYYRVHPELKIAEAKEVWG